MAWYSVLPPSSLFTDISPLMSVGRDFPFHSRADSQHTFEVLEELVAVGIFHAVTYLWFFKSVFDR